MEEDSSWSDDEVCYTRKGTGVFHPCMGDFDKDDSGSDILSLDLVLPDDLQEQILAFLPLACILKSSCVCKRWNEIVHSIRFMSNISSTLSKRPWYFMFTSIYEPSGFLYDPCLQKWYCFELPCWVKSNSHFASSNGLACFMDYDTGNELYVCNPLTRTYRKLEEPSGSQLFDYTSLAFSVEKSTLNYTVAIVRSEQISGNDEWNISIQFYHSETRKWLTSVMKTSMGWRAGYDSVICNGVLYILIHYTRLDDTGKRHALLTCSLRRPLPSDMSIDARIRAPCSLTCGRLMNLQDRLVMVGGIGRQDRPDVIRGIGIWALQGTDWEEIARMPHKFFHGFGELDDVFTSSGAGHLIYIQSYGAAALLVFDMNLKEWYWSHKCPLTKKFPLQLFSGFCFEPRLEVNP